MRKYSNTFNPNLIKINRSYSVPELAEQLGKHTSTVLNWHKKEGLQAIDKNKPYMFHGKEIRRFIRERQAKRKHKLSPNEFFCFKCQKPRASANNEVMLFIQNQKQINIKGYCSVCNTAMNRRDAVINLPKLKELFRIELIHNEALLGHSSPITTIDLKGDANNEGNNQRTETIKLGE